MIGVLFAIGAVGVDLKKERWKSRGDRLEWFDVPARRDLHLHSAVPGLDGRSDGVDQLRGRREGADDRARFDLLTFDPEQRGERAPLRPEMGVGHRHLEGREGHRRTGSPGSHGPESARSRQQACGTIDHFDEGGNKYLFERDEAGGDVLFDVLRVSQRGALSPPVQAIGTQVRGHSDQKQLSLGVRRRGGGNRTSERKLDPPELNGFESESGLRTEDRPRGPRGAECFESVGSGLGSLHARRSYGASRCVIGAPVGCAHPPARVAEWQTRWTQNPLSERACGFDSRPGHGVLPGAGSRWARSDRCRPQFHC